MSTDVKSMKGILGIRIFRDWLGLFAEDALRSVSLQEYPFLIGEECLASLRETVLEELYDTARYAMDRAAMRSIGMSADPMTTDPGIEDLRALKALVNSLKEKGRDAFEDTAPSLREELEAKAESCRRALLIMFRRIGENRSAIERVLLHGRPFGSILGIKRRGSLLYASDRIVTEIVTDGGRFLYKPRDLRIDGWFMELVKPYTGGLVCVPDTLCCGETCGFTEYAENEPADSIRLTPENAYALGALCAFIYMTGASDLHEGNVFVSKGRICLIDLEVILIKHTHTGVPSSVRHLTDMFRELIRAEEDRFFAGLTDTCRRCMAEREKLSAAVEQAGSFWIRDMIRGGGQYGRLVRVHRQLEGMCSREERLAGERDLKQALRETAAEDHKVFSDAELEHVLRGSSMVLSLRAGERDAYCDGRLLVKEYISQSPVEKTKSVINGMTERTLQQIIYDLRRYVKENDG